MRKPPPTPHKSPRLQLAGLLPHAGDLGRLANRVKYRGSPYHKENPLTFGLQPSQTPQDDKTLCDGYAGFRPDQVQFIGDWMRRGISAGLVSDQWNQGVPHAVWAIADDGWIYEARVTNVTTAEYHGYPVPLEEPIAKLVYDRFRAWVANHPKPRHSTAAEQCRERYGF